MGYIKHCIVEMLFYFISWTTTTMICRADKLTDGFIDVVLVLHILEKLF